ncbi:MAG: TlpA disulfide reductase family protein [Pirellulales bacterium]
MNSPANHCAAEMWAVWIACLPLAIAGCSPNAIDAGSAPQSAPRSISLRVAGVEGYDETLARLRGKVVLVDFWATWCAPCIEQFPHTVALEGKYHDRGLAVVGVSLNEPDEEPQVREFLARHEADFENLLSEYGSGVAAIKAFGLPGPIPCYRLYDRSGELHREFAVDPRAKRQFTPEDIDAAIAELL